MIRPVQMPSGNLRPPVAYRLYGLGLRSHWPLPCPAGRGTEPAEIEMFDGPAHLFSEASREAGRRSNGERWFRYRRLPDGSDYLRWSGLFEFLISRDGHRIACRPLNGTPREAFHAYLLGQVLSFALIKRGIEPLHATAVVIDGKAVGFIGDCGYGKSTLAATFLQAGHPLLTDDLLVMKEEGDGFAAYSGPPRIKLFPAIAKRLLGGRATGTPMNPLTPKLVIPLGRDGKGAWQGAAPLKAIYVLMPSRKNSRKGISIRSLSPRRALLALLKNTFNPVIVEPARLERQLDLTSRLASKVPVKALSFPKRLATLPAVRDAILSDVRA